MDELLIKRAKRGDKESFTQAVLEVKDHAYRIAFCYLHNEADSMDAVCDAVEKAYVNINKLKDAKLFSTWFIRILINECKQQLRTKYDMVEMTDDIDIHASNGIDLDTKMDLENLLGRLPSSERILIYMKYYLGYTLEEIAEATNMSCGTVKTKIYGNLKKVRASLEMGEV